MRNDDLLRQLGWSEALIADMSKTAAELQAVAQISPVPQDAYQVRFSVTTDRIFYQGGASLESPRE